VPPPLRRDDIVIFTHADGDHFSAESLLANYAGNVIIGPPSIALPLVKSGRIDCDTLRIDYPEQAMQPKTFQVNGVTISMYQSRHFIGWNPVHCSYLIEYENRSVFITGDSLMEPELMGKIGCDCIVCNLVDKGFITKTEDSRHAVHHHMSYLLSILAKAQPKKILANHLIGFDGTIDPHELKELVDRYGFTEIVVPVSAEEIVRL
jgi:L-ascorbate metabolism protein UlaG (beta-lactamase superfamily)